MSKNDMIVDKICKLVIDAEKKFEEGTKYLDNFSTIADIEKMWSDLRLNTNIIYNELYNKLINEIDDKKIIDAKKKELKKKGINLVSNRRAWRTILTINGPISYARAVLVPKDEKSAKKLMDLYGLKSIAPIDDILGIAELPFKMTIQTMLLCAYWAQNQGSYQAAEERIFDAFGLKISDDTIRKVTNYIGNIIFEYDCKNASNILDKIKDFNIEEKDKKDGILYIEVDGCAINTVEKDKDGSTWRENKMGMVFSSDNITYYKNKKGEIEHRIDKREYISYIGSVDQFKLHLLYIAFKNGYLQYKTTIILSDGASWIKKMADELFPDAILILDFYHLSENVYNYAKAKFDNNEDKYKPWAENILSLLKNSDYDSALKILNPDEVYKDTVRLYHYIFENRDRIDYKKYEEKGYFIGSGAIESANKLVAQKRLKLPGMRWRVKNAQNILAIRSKVESNLWHELIVALISAYCNKWVNCR